MIDRDLAGTDLLMWVGWDTPDLAGDCPRMSDSDAGEGSTISAASAPRLPGWQAFERSGPGVDGPRWLSMCAVADARSLPALMPHPGRASWMAFWRRLSTKSVAQRSTASIYLVGMDPPAAEAVDLLRFNEYYDAVHIPEVLDVGSFHRATRYELIANRGLGRTPMPRYCAVYEADAQTTARRAERAHHRSPGRAAHPDSADAPDIWVRRTTAWRLTYQPVT